MVAGARSKANREGLKVTVAERTLLTTPARMADMSRRQNKAALLEWLIELEERRRAYYW